jgi:hypothetical protein
LTLVEPDDNIVTMVEHEVQDHFGYWCMLSCLWTGTRNDVAFASHMLFLETCMACDPFLASLHLLAPGPGRFPFRMVEQSKAAHSQANAQVPRLGDTAHPLHDLEASQQLRLRRSTTIPQPAGLTNQGGRQTLGKRWSIRA